MFNHSSSVKSVQRELEKVKQRICHLPPDTKSVRELRDLMPNFFSKTLLNY